MTLCKGIVVALQGAEASTVGDGVIVRCSRLLVVVISAASHHCNVQPCTVVGYTFCVMLNVGLN